MATRIKKQTPKEKEVASPQSTSKNDSSTDSPSRTTPGPGRPPGKSGLDKWLIRKNPVAFQGTSKTAATATKASIGKRIAKQKTPKKLVKTQNYNIKLKAKNKKPIKLGQKLAKTILKNAKTLESKKNLLKNGVKEVKPKRARKKALKEELPPVLEPIFPLQENLQKKPRKRAKKAPKTLEIDPKKIKSEPIDDDASDVTDISTAPADVIPKQRKPRQKKQQKIENDSLEDVMNDLSFLIKTEDIKKEVDSMSESSRSDSIKPKRLTKRQRLELIQKNMIKKENIENTLSKLDSSEQKVIDMLDLNVRKIKKESPLAKRRHSIEKFPIGSLDASTDAVQSVFNNLPRCISPRASKRTTKLGGMKLKRSSPYTTRSDSPARILRNGKHRKLKDMNLLEGLDCDLKKRKRLCSDLSGSESVSKFSGYDSDSSFSEGASMHGSEKETTTIKESIEEDIDKPAMVIKRSLSMEEMEQKETKLIDTNSNVCKDLNANKEIQEPLNKSSPVPLSPSLKVPEKNIILDIMKVAFNEDSDKATAPKKSPPKWEVDKFYGKNETLKGKEEVKKTLDVLEEMAPKNLKENVETSSPPEGKLDETLDSGVVLFASEVSTSTEMLVPSGLVLTASEVNLEDINQKEETEQQVIIPLEEEFGSEEKECEEQQSFEDIVQGCINSIAELTPEAATPVVEDLEDIPVIENMSEAFVSNISEEHMENLGPPLLESNVEKDLVKIKEESNEENEKEIKGKEKIVDKEEVVDKVEIVDKEEIAEKEEMADKEEIADKEDIINKEEKQSKIVNVEGNNMEVDDNLEQMAEKEELIETEDKAAVEEGVATKNEDILEEVRTDENCDKNTEASEKILEESEIQDEDGSPKPSIEESAEELAQKENILKALGLQSLKAAEEAKLHKGKDKPVSKSDSYTGTLKTVIKINREKKKGRNSLKMTLQKNRGKIYGEQGASEEGYKIMKDSPSTSWKHSKDSSDTAGAHRKSHYSNRSNPDGSSEHTSDGEAGPQDTGAAKALVIPEKASSFSIHPGRLCKDECSYCFGKFGLFDTPCHIAQMKSVERQNKILATEKHLTRDSCLCDACYRHVDRKSNTPSYTNRSLKRNSLVAPGPRQNHCHVLGCSNVSSNILRRKWIIKMRKSICQVINIDLDNPGLHSIPICDEHYSALEHLMVCAMCKRRLARNHIHYLGPEVQDLNAAMNAEGIPLTLTDKPVVCKLCKCFASVILKGAEERPENSNEFFTEYKRRLLHFNDIVPMDAAAADEPIAVPTKTDKLEMGKKKKKLNKNASATSDTDNLNKNTSENENDQHSESRVQQRVPSTDTNHSNNSNSQSQSRSRSESPDDDEYGVDYNTLIPAIAMDCPGENDTKKEYFQKLPPAVIVRKIPRLESVKDAIEASKNQSLKPEKSKHSEIAVQRLGSNPSISVRQLFPGEEDLPLNGHIDFKNVIEKTPEGWEKVATTIQYDEETKHLWQELQKPYGNQSSFLRHLILLEKYFRNGDLMLSPTASHHAINYRESVYNRLRAYDNIPSNAGNIQPISMIPFNKMKSNSGIITSVNHHGNGNGTAVSISQVAGGGVPKGTPITLQQLNSPPLIPTNSMLQQIANARPKPVGAPPGLISLHPGTTRPVAPVVMKQPPQSQKIKFPITKNWRPNLIPIDLSKKQERKVGLVQVISGGKPYHITLEDYKKMCAIKRSFEAKQKRLQEAQQQAKSILVTHNSVLKSITPRKGLIISKTATVTSPEPLSRPTIPMQSLNLENNANSESVSSETILEKLDKQIEKLGQEAVVIKQQQPNSDKSLLLPKIPKSLTVIPQTVRKQRPTSPVMFITPKSNVNPGKS